MKMDELVQYLIESNVLKTKAVIDAFKKIDRKDFVLPEYRDEAYTDTALSIGYGQTISQPTVVAFMLELLGPRPKEKILDLGSGSGWTAALLAYLVGTEGIVYGVERLPELVEFGGGNLKKYGFKNVSITLAREAELGLPANAPFDKILVSAASDDIPQKLIKQLRVGGILVMPVRSAVWKAEKKSESDLSVEKFEGFSFVPLVK